MCFINIIIELVNLLAIIHLVANVDYKNNLYSKYNMLVYVACTK